MTATTSQLPMACGSSSNHTLFYNQTTLSTPRTPADCSLTTRCVTLRQAKNAFLSNETTALNAKVTLNLQVGSKCLDYLLRDLGPSNWNSTVSFSLKLVTVLKSPGIIDVTKISASNGIIDYCMEQINRSDNVLLDVFQWLRYYAEHSSKTVEGPKQRAFVNVLFDA